MQYKFTNEDLMELEAQSKDKERQEEEVTKQIHDTEWQGLLYLRRHYQF